MSSISKISNLNTPDQPNCHKLHEIYPKPGILNSVHLHMDTSGLTPWMRGRPLALGFGPTHDG